MLYGITINNIHSYRHLGLCLSSRKIEPPTKKSITKTVPYCNGYYDFSKLNDTYNWESRKVKYSFEIAENTIEKADIERSKATNFFGDLYNVAIYDDTVKDYYLKGSFDSFEIDEDDSGMKLTITVVFNCYPLWISKYPKSFIVYDNSITIDNKGQPTNLYATSQKQCQISLNNTLTSVMETSNDVILNGTFKKGINNISIDNDYATVNFCDMLSSNIISINGMTITRYPDSGYISIVGTATQDTEIIIKEDNTTGYPINSGNYKFSASYNNYISSENCKFKIIIDNTEYTDNGIGVIINFKSTITPFKVILKITKDTKFIGDYFSPRLIAPTTIKYIEEIL